MSTPKKSEYLLLFRGTDGTRVSRRKRSNKS